jgi:hypothetical protein
MTDTEIDALVLEVLAGQSADYLIQPDASAFFAVDLDAETVSASLARLDAAGTAREDEVVVMEYASDPVMIPEIDDKGQPVLDGNDAPVMVQATAPDGTPLTMTRLDGNGEPVLTPQLDEAGNQVTVTSGWCITDAGKATVG